MAKYERRVTGEFDTILTAVHQAVMEGSRSANLLSGSYYNDGQFQCAVRMYERMSVAGYMGSLGRGNSYVNLSMTLSGCGGLYCLVVITAGHGNGLGEDAFLNAVGQALDALFDVPQEKPEKGRT